jgi:hypothetical protein
MVRLKTLALRSRVKRKRAIERVTSVTDVNIIVPNMNIAMLKDLLSKREIGSKRPTPVTDTTTSTTLRGIVYAIDQINVRDAILRQARRCTVLLLNGSESTVSPPATTTL